MFTAHQCQAVSGRRRFRCTTPFLEIPTGPRCPARACVHACSDAPCMFGNWCTCGDGRKASLQGPRSAQCESQPNDCHRFSSVAARISLPALPSKPRDEFNASVWLICPSTGSAAASRISRLCWFSCWSNSLWHPVPKASFNPSTRSLFERVFVLCNNSLLLS